MMVTGLYLFTGSYGYVIFYFEDYAEQRPHTLLIEGRMEGQPEPFILSTVFRLSTSP